MGWAFESVPHFGHNKSLKIDILCRGFDAMGCEFSPRAFVFGCCSESCVLI